MLEITAYKFISEGIFRDTQNGIPLDEYCGAPFQGYCMIYFDDGSQMIFDTGINQDGERYWFAEGNNPKKEYVFI